MGNESGDVTGESIQAADAQRWEPEPVPAEDFHCADAWANVNRAPYDRVSGVLYKRAANIQRILYCETSDTTGEDAPDATNIPYASNSGAIVARLLFSEAPGSEEQVLAGYTFAYLHDVRLAPSSEMAEQATPETRVLYVLQGEGRLRHRPTQGSPFIVRPLLPGDAALVGDGEFHGVVNTSAERELRLLVVGLTAPAATRQER